MFELIRNDFSNTKSTTIDVDHEVDCILGTEPSST